jgi:hypothetical protein
MWGGERVVPTPGNGQHCHMGLCTRGLAQNYTYIFTYALNLFSYKL